MEMTYEEMVTQNMGLVRHVSKRYRGRADYEDILQCGYYGLCEAAQRFDPTRGVRFATFACSYITGRIHRYYREFAISPVKLPRSMVDAICRGEQENVVCLHDTVSEDSSYLSQIPYAYNLEDQCISSLELRSIIHYVKMNFRERDVKIYLCALLDNVNQKEIARKFSVSQTKVSRTIKRINTKIQNRFRKGAIYESKAANNRR
jgi:RNA polymerase sigma factor (sigma-70 family)